jgi:serine/threonine-protein kinase
MGTQLDARSDLYSLSLVLIEAVTGRVPFSADTTIGMLTARTQRSVTAPDELGPLVPVVERAGRVEVAARYPNAATMRAALVDVGESLPPPGPLPLAGMFDGADPHPTRTVEPIMSADLFDQDAADAAAAAPAAEPVRRERRERGVRRLVPFVVTAVLAVTIVLAAAAIAQVGGSTSEVPAVVGYSLDQARTAADHAGFSVDVKHESAPDPEGTVISQSPEGGTFAEGDTVRLTVSSGPPKVAVPEVAGKKRDDAAAALTGAGFALAPDVQDYNNDVPTGVVISVDPAQGTQVGPDSQITMHVSKGHAPVKVPEVAGRSLDQARATLQHAGFKTDRASDAFSDTVPAGQVVGTSPGAGATAPYGSTVQIAVSKGPDIVDLPNLLGVPLGDALAQLQTLGMPAQVNGPMALPNPVTAQAPPPGQMKRGTPVVLTP